MVNLGFNVEPSLKGAEADVDLLHQFDLNALSFVNYFAGSSHVLDHAIRGIAKLYSTKFLPFYMVMWWLWFRGGADQDDRRLLIIRIVLAVLITIVISRGVQNFMPERLRPLHDPTVSMNVPLGLDRDVFRDWSSFPSDHAAIAFAIVTGFFGISRALGIASAAWATLLIAAPRVYLGLHYPTDIIAGALLGVAIMLPLLLVGMPARLNRFILYVEANYSAWFYAAAFFLFFQLTTMLDDIRQVVEALTE